MLRRRLHAWGGAPSRGAASGQVAPRATPAQAELGAGSVQAQRRARPGVYDSISECVLCATESRLSRISTKDSEATHSAELGENVRVCARPGLAGPGYSTRAGREALRTPAAKSGAAWTRGGGRTAQSPDEVWELYSRIRHSFANKSHSVNSVSLKTRAERLSRT